MIFSRKYKYRVSRHVSNLRKENKVKGRRLTKRRTKGSTKKDRMSKLYIEWRNFVFERDGFTCQRCFTTDTYLNAHHIKPWSLFPKHRYDVSNGVTLCEKCHTYVHSHKKNKFLDLGRGINAG